MSVYMSFCAECSEKTAAQRIITEASASHYGYCQGCFANGAVRQYELGPTWEAAARMRHRNKTPRPRAGERSKT